MGGLATFLRRCFGRSAGGRTVKTPSILQFEAVECGAASLAMILAHYGAWIPLEVLRTACGVSRDGAKASNIVRAARDFKLIAKGFKKEPEGLADLPLPAIIHWNFNHYVVFKGFSGGRAYINDPASGPRVVSMEEFGESFTGVALAFEPGEGFAPQGRPAGLFDALKARLTGSGNAFALIGVISLALVLPGIVLPAFSKMFVDGILVNHQDRWVIPLLLGMIITAIVRTALTILQQRALIRLETKLAVVGAAQLIWHLIRLPMGFFTQRHPGEVASRVAVNDKVAKLMSGQLSNTMVQLGEAAFFAIVMLAYNPLLGAIAITLAAPNYFLLRYAQAYIQESAGRTLSTYGKLAAVTVGAIQNIETLKASGFERQTFERWAGHHANNLDAMRQQGFQNAFLTMVPAVLVSLSASMILGFGAWQVMSGALTIGDLVAFQTLAASFITPIAAIAGMGPVVTGVKVSLQRVDDALKNVPDRLADAAHMQVPSVPSPPLRGQVELADVTFGYSRLEPPLLKSLNVKLTPGTRIAFVGGSGSGKSTIGRLICGLIEPWSGDVLFDGKPLIDVPQRQRARSLAYVDQDIFLFEGSVRDNLTLWNRGVPDEKIIKALADAAILDDITVRPGQIDGHVEEGGRNFSGGQRQRLEIARALVGDPSVLVLDEATAALDAATEKLIDDNIRRRGCTCIIIAHRLSTIRDCEEIILLSRGRVVERGTHDELIALGGEYANLIRAH
jgi:NHLM bacteriocin system ABC transporter peptidase/ATP-binding protein